MTEPDPGGWVSPHFIYREGDHDDIKTAHEEAFQAHAELEYDFPFVRAEFGSMKWRCEDVPELTDISWIENYQYEGETESWNLLYAPMMSYYLDDWSRQLDTESKIRRFLDTVVTGYEATEKRPEAVFLMTERHSGYVFNEPAGGRPPFTAESLAHGRYEHLCWLTVFTPPMVETYGRETLLSAPAWHIEELEDGAVLLCCTDSILDWHQGGGQAVADHIGLKNPF